MLACRKHWYDLPGQLRVAILTSYRGCDRKGYVANVRAVGRGATIDSLSAPSPAASDSPVGYHN